MKISVNVLCYGDYPELARRCLESVLRLAHYDIIRDVRVGLNAVCPETAQYVEQAGRIARQEGCPAFYTYTPERNVGKYPLMRRMFYDPQASPLAELTMWFDDDSFLDQEAMADLYWWQKLVAYMQQPQDMIGSLYRLRGPHGGYRGNQIAAIKAQPWYTGQSLETSCRFATGGWWTARTTILERWGYPFRELHHNGGDSILGELCRQQNYRLGDWKKGVAINWDKGESRAARRGLTTPWVWEHYDATKPVDLSHHAFACAVRSLGP